MSLVVRSGEEGGGVEESKGQREDNKAQEKAEGGESGAGEGARQGSARKGRA